MKLMSTIQFLSRRSARPSRNDSPRCASTRWIKLTLLGYALLFAAIPRISSAELVVTNVFYGWDDLTPGFENGNVRMNANGTWTSLLHQMGFNTTAVADACGVGTSTVWAGTMQLGLYHTDNAPLGAPGFQASRFWELIQCDRDGDGTGIEGGHGDLHTQPYDGRTVIDTASGGNGHITLVSQDVVTSCTTGNCQDEIITTLRVNLDLNCDGVIDANIPDSNPNDSKGVGICFYAEALKPFTVPDPWAGNIQARISAGGGDKTVNFNPLTATHAVISSFKAYADGGHALLEWKTVSEVGTIGFDLLRLDPASGTYRQVNDKLLPALLVAPQGGSYRFVDSGAAVGGTYSYRLVEVEAKGKRNTYGPFTVTVSGAPASAPSAVRNISAGGGYYSMESHAPSARSTANASRKRGASTAAQAKTLRPASAANATLTAAGLYYLSAAEIGAILGTGAADVSQRIQQFNFELSNQDKPVAYTPAASYAGLYFYGEALDSTFSKDNAYRLRKAAGERMRTVDGGKPAPRANPGSFTDSVHAEQDRYAATALFTDPKADYWFWDFVLGGVGGMDNKPFTLRADGAASTGTATLSVQLHGATETEAALDHHAVVRVNGTVVGEDRWNGTTARTLNISFNQGLLVDGTNTVEVQGLLDGDAPYSVFYVDSLDLTYQRQYRAVGNQLLARAGGGVVTIGGFTDPKISVFDLADPRQPRFLTATTIDQADGGYRVSFNAAGEGPYLAVALSAVRAPNSFRADAAADLRDNRAGADYLVIAPAALQDAAQALVNYRQTRGLTVKLVELEAVYDQFSHGIAGPGAIRDFLAYAHANWGRKPRYAVLAGEGSFDYRNNQGYGDSVVPPLLVGTAHGLFASDSVLGDVVGNDGVPEIAVGRLPAANATELQALVNKIIAYESGAGSNRVLLLADNPDGGGNFPADSDTVAALLPGNIAADKVYLSQATLADARQQLFGALAGGVGLVNYIGHGGIDRFASEGLWLTSDVATLANTRFPVVAALTCIAGQYALPGYDSLGESLLLKSGGGAAAFWGPSGLSENEQAKLLDQQFVRAVYVDGERVLGDAILKAMRGYVQGGAPASLLNIYNLLGDPALQLR